MRCSMLHVPGATRAAKRVGCSIVTTERGQLAHSEGPRARRRRPCVLHGGCNGKRNWTRRSLRDGCRRGATVASFF
jgi:hypothetical protein